MMAVSFSTVPGLLLTYGCYTKLKIFVSSELKKNKQIRALRGSETIGNAVQLKSKLSLKVFFWKKLFRTYIC